MSEPPPWMVYVPSPFLTLDPLNVGPPTSASNHWIWALALMLAKRASTPVTITVNAARSRHGYNLLGFIQYYTFGFGFYGVNCISLFGNRAVARLQARRRRQARARKCAPFSRHDMLLSYRDFHAPRAR